MAVDPYIARGITPLGQGLPELALQMRGQQQRYELGKQDLANDTRRLGIYEQQVGIQGQQHQQQASDAQFEQEARMAYAMLKAGQPQFAIAKMSEKSPEFALFAKVDPQRAAEAARTALEQHLGVKQDEVGGVKIGQYNPGDYTPETWAPFLKSGDPSGLKRQYAPPAPPNMTVVQLPEGQGAFNPRTGAVMPLSDRTKQREAEVADVQAETAAKAQVEAATTKTTKDAEKQAAWKLYEAARSGLMSGLEGSETGPIAGRIPAITSAQQTAEGGVAAMAPVLKQLFRVAGEGVFTDRDQALLIEMVPTRKDTPEARKNKMDNIDAIVRAKVGMSASSGPKPGDIVKGYRFKGGDPGKKESWEKQ
jgi:hypothetical protein